MRGAHLIAGLAAGEALRQVQVDGRIRRGAVPETWTQKELEFRDSKAVEAL